MNTRQVRMWKRKMIRQRMLASGTHSHAAISAPSRWANQAAVREAWRGGGFCARARRRIRSVSTGSGGQAI
jgi:hypothetical protein